MIGNSTGTVERMSSSKDAPGGTIKNWFAVYSDVPMRDEITGSREDIRAGKRVMVTNHRVYTMQAGITIGMRIVFAGKNMPVIGESPRLERSPAIPTWYEIDCEHVAEMTPL